MDINNCDLASLDLATEAIKHGAILDSVGAALMSELCPTGEQRELVAARGVILPANSIYALKIINEGASTATNATVVLKYKSTGEPAE